MAYVFFNNNPKKQRVGDCVIRAIGKAVGQDWTDAYIGLCSEGLVFKDLPSSNYVWGMYLKKYGFEEHMISSVCPNCMTVSEFLEAITDKNPKDIWMVMDELMSTLQALNPRLYQATMDRIKQ